MGCAKVAELLFGIVVAAFCTVADEYAAWRGRLRAPDALLWLGQPVGCSNQKNTVRVLQCHGVPKTMPLPRRTTASCVVAAVRARPLAKKHQKQLKLSSGLVRTLDFRFDGGIEYVTKWH